MNRKTVPGREFRRPIMARSRRESHHSDGITDPNNLQQISATKSAQSGRAGRRLSRQLSGVKRTSRFQCVTSAFDPKRTFAAKIAVVHNMAGGQY